MDLSALAHISQGCILLVGHPPASFAVTLSPSLEEQPTPVPAYQLLSLLYGTSII